MKRYNKDLGDFGEAAAAVYMAEKGYMITERNFRTKFGEIDLIAENENWLVFVEVKTRSSNSYGLPSEAVDLKKQTHLYKTAVKYVSDNPTEKEIRFDVIEIYANMINGTLCLESINHIENIIIEVS